MTLPNLYAKRKFLRSFEKVWAWADGIINRFAKSDFNPLYHLGTLTIFMLLVLIATGTYLVLLYRPGLDVAYLTMQKIDSTWFGIFIRSVHRYASDAMILLVVLHMLRMLSGDRFWGARWLAWTSGWIMLAGVWLTGTLGYWMVWDTRAQWMTEFMMQTVAGTSGLTYVATDIESRTFSNFVIVIFLHVFLPLIGFLGIYVHSIRLSRARWWAPRWVAVQALIGLAFLALIKPVQLLSEVDLTTLPKNVPIDMLYLGLLPMIDVWGNIIFWGLAVLVVGSLFMLPWLFKGRDLGPAVVDDPKCIGCNLCYAECPYDAIRMIDRSDDTPYTKLAVVNPDQCTGCGICVGACPTDAIDLKIGHNNDRTFNALKDAVNREADSGHPVTVLFTSMRDEALGGIPASLTANRGDAPFAVSSWGADDGRILTMALPSIATVNIEWIKSLQKEKVRDVVIVSQPYDDNIYREGSHWMANRLQMRSALMTENLHWLDATPNDSKSVANLLDNLHQSKAPKKKIETAVPQVKDRNKMIPSLVGGIIGAILLLGIFALALPLDVNSSMKAASQSGLRIAVDAKGKIEAAAIPPGIVLPEGADPVKIFGGTHFPVSVRVVVDGETILEKTYKPSGISGNGRISALEFLEVAPGEHQVDVWMKDDADDFRLSYSGKVDFAQGGIQLISYEDKLGEFDLR